MVGVGGGGRSLMFRHNPGKQKSADCSRKQRPPVCLRPIDRASNQAIEPPQPLAGRPTAALFSSSFSPLLWVCFGLLPPSTSSAAAAVEDGAIRLIGFGKSDESPLFSLSVAAPKAGGLRRDH